VSRSVERERRRHVAVVDDNTISLNGDVVSLAAHPLIDVVAGVDHAEALRWTDADWAALDAVVVDAACPFDEDNHYREGDHFPGVAVVERARRTRPDLLVIVVTGRFFEDGLRRRMKEAGADFFYFRDHLRDPDQLHRVVLEPESCRAGVPDVEDPDTLAALGVDDRSLVNRFVAYLDGRGGLAATGRGHKRRRRDDRTRAEATDAGIRAVNKTTGAPPHARAQRDPSRRQLADIWAAFAQVRETRSDSSPPPPEGRTAAADLDHARRQGNPPGGADRPHGPERAGGEAIDIVEQGVDPVVIDGDGDQHHPPR
jgi:hypothetical protein